MTTLTAAEAYALWAGVDDQRTRTTRMLEGLTPEQWDHPSWCDGWSVRHVAAHLTMQQQTFGDLVGFIARHPRMLRSVTLNATIHDSAVIRAQELSTAQITDAIRATIGSRRHNSFVTPLETLTDALVHSQDIAGPLGLDLEMRPAPCALAASRRWDTRGSWMAWVNRRLPLDGHRFRATDTDWERGHGPEVAGPIGAILLLITGRPVALSRLDGDGATVPSRAARFAARPAHLSHAVRFDLETVASTDQVRRAFTETSYGGGGAGLVRATPRPGGGSRVHAEWTSTDIRRQRAFLFVVHHTALHRMIQRQWTPTLDEFAAERR